MFLLFDECPEGVGTVQVPEAYDLTYRDYGAPLARASGEVRLCLGPQSRVLKYCGEYPGYPAAEPQYLSYPAVFRFFDVVRCTSHVLSGQRLFYGKVSYTFAGRPWE
ncbi:MAG TPA: hypothetical protein VMB91_03430, partial [Solirubrobacteraceae bacterium]|nr:hypothetical protein [Solirubrobacteraceae bacterium]